MRSISIKISSSGGYTLLFAMIVASIVLALGVSLLTISRKEFILSSSATQSTNAFYAADSGLGCAEYWNANGAFATSSSASPVECAYVLKSGLYDLVNVPSAKSGPLASASVSLPVTGIVANSIYEYAINVPFSTDGTSNLSCANIIVDKYIAPSSYLGGSNYSYTTITSAGYNIGWNGTVQDASAGQSNGACSSPSPKKVNRTVQLTF